MCGIVAVRRLAGALDAREIVDRMAGALAHRGPDDEGVFFEGSCKMGGTVGDVEGVKSGGGAGQNVGLGVGAGVGGQKNVREKVGLER